MLKEDLEEEMKMRNIFVSRNVSFEQRNETTKRERVSERERERITIL